MLAAMEKISGAEPSQEIAHRPSTQLARTAPLNKQIQHYRSINELDLRQTLWTGMPAGFALALAQTGELATGLLAIPLLGIAVVSGVKLLRRRRKSVQAGQAEYKSGDYTAIQMWAPFLPALGWLVAIPLDFLGFEALETPPLISGVFGGLLFGAGISFGAWGMWNQAFRIGKRRIKKITEKQSLDGVSESRMEAVEENGDILGALVTAGAVDGNELSVASLGKLMDWDNEEIPALQARANELQSSGVVKISGQGLYQKAKHWQVTITPDGIRNIAQLGHR